jgi:hypothetical protein
MSPRLSIAVAVLTASLVASGAFAGAHAGVHKATASDPGSPVVRLLECSRGEDPQDRWAVFRGSMSQVEGSEGMRMRFFLFERVGKSVWRGVHAPGLAMWHDSAPGVSRFAYRQRIAALLPATRYHVKVDFRWLDSQGEQLAARWERSPVCRQSGRLPNLSVRDDIAIRPGPTSGTRRYVVRIGNNGVARARHVALALLVDGAEVDMRRVGPLRSGDRRIVRFVGPDCADSVEARLDPKDVVREITERDNDRKADCRSTEAADGL